jgi:hypothetical protein
MEYIPGVTISEMGSKRALKVLSYFEPYSRNRMIRIGFVFALDLLMNNRSRLPSSVWEWSDAGLEHLILNSNPSYTDTTKELKDPDNLNFDYDVYISFKY